jgi:hypothetical protein
LCLIFCRPSHKALPPKVVARFFGTIRTVRRGRKGGGGEEERRGGGRRKEEGGRRKKEGEKEGGKRF